jgi:para-aminobenzoate synthetase component 1
VTSVSPPTLRDLRSAAEALRARGEPFACLVSALGHPELGRRSLLADGLALEWSSDTDPGQKPVIERLREAARLAFSQGACGLLLLATHEAVAEFETVPVHPDWRALPRLQLWSARSLQQLAPSDETPGGWGAPTAMPQLHPTVSSQGQAVSSEEGDGRERWHASAVEKAREAIAAGRLYQLCLTFPLRFAPPEDPAALFAWLMSQHPVDHGAWLHLPGRGDRPGLELLSASPERFFALRGREVTARPMKGTRRITPETAEALMRELASSSKDRAENVMIADLVRNDLGRVCVAGSVRAESLWEVERYASVAQMTSTITGELRSGLDVFDVFAAAFPPGSMTGAPKIEACRMIHELESGPRGLYGGAIGWLDPSGDASFSVVIRTLQISGDEARWDIGGGIVHDSTAEGEWAEAQAKSAPLRGLRDGRSSISEVASGGDG